MNAAWNIKCRCRIKPDARRFAVAGSDRARGTRQAARETAALACTSRRVRVSLCDAAQRVETGKASAVSANLVSPDRSRAGRRHAASRDACLRVGFPPDRNRHRRRNGISYLQHNVQMASLDHALWFHRPFRVDEWLLYSCDSPTTQGARGLTRGMIFSRDGRLVASTAQEGMIRILPETLSSQASSGAA